MIDRESAAHIGRGELSDKIQMIMPVVPCSYECGTVVFS